MMSYISYRQAKVVVAICGNLLKYGTIDDKYVVAEHLKHIRSTKIDNYQQSPFVFSANPIKDYAMVIHVLVILRKKYTDIKYISDELITAYSESINEVIKATDDINVSFVYYSHFTLRKLYPKIMWFKLSLPYFSRNVADLSLLISL